MTTTTTTATFVSSTGLPDLGRSRTAPRGKMYRPFDRPTGSPLFVPSRFTMTTGDGPRQPAVHLRMVRGDIAGRSESGYGVLSVSVAPPDPPPDTALAVAHEITAALTPMIGSAVGAEPLVASGSPGAGSIDFQWALSHELTTAMAASIEQGIQPFSLEVSLSYHAVDTSDTTDRSRPVELPDVIELVSTSVVEPIAVGAETAMLVEQTDTDDLPDGTWRIEATSVMSDRLLGAETLGVRFTAPANPPNRPQDSESAAWFDGTSYPSATLRLSPLDPRQGQAEVVGLFRTPTGVEVLVGPAREHRGPLYVMRPDDIGVEVIHLRAEPALLRDSKLTVEAFHRDEQGVLAPLISAELEGKGLSMALTDPANTVLVASVESIDGRFESRSVETPARSAVVDRGWFPGFGPGRMTITCPELADGEHVELELRLRNEQPEDASRVHLIGPVAEAEWRFFNRSPFDPMCLYRASERLEDDVPWLGPVAVAADLALTDPSQGWRLGLTEEVPSSPPDGGIDMEPTDGSFNELIEGVECHWNSADPSRVTYWPPTISPQRNRNHIPLISLIVSGASVSVQVSASWTLDQATLLAVRAALAERLGMAEALLRLQPASVSAITAELVTVGEPGAQDQETVIATTTTSGFGGHNAALQAAVDDPNQRNAISAAFNGEPGRLLVRYRADDLDLTADVGQWVAASPSEHRTVIPGQS